MIQFTVVMLGSVAQEVMVTAGWLAELTFEN